MANITVILLVIKQQTQKQLLKQQILNALTKGFLTYIQSTCIQIFE